MNFKKFISGESKTEKINESIIVGSIITKTLSFIAQVHLWHLLIQSGQKHSALGQFYTELQEEIDGLAEKYLARGFEVNSSEFQLIADTTNGYILIRTESFRNEIVNAIEELKDNSNLQSIFDGLVDLQEVIDQFNYRFNLD